MNKLPEETAHQNPENIWTPDAERTDSRTATSALTSGKRTKHTAATCNSSERTVEKRETEEVQMESSANKDGPQGTSF